MSETCNEKDLGIALLKLSRLIEQIKKNSCSLERKYYHYPDVKFAKKPKKILNVSRDKKLENDWGLPDVFQDM